MTVNVYRFYDSASPVPAEVTSMLERYRKFRVFKAVRKVLWADVSVAGDEMKMLMSFTLSLISAILLVFLHENILAGCFIFFSLCLYLSLFIGAVREKVRMALTVTSASDIQAG